MRSKEDVLLGVASFVIAFLLWFTTQPLFEPGKQLEFAVPVQFEGLNEENFVAMTSPGPVMVVASGTSVDLDRLDSQAVEARVDLSSVKPGLNRLPISVGGASVPGVEIESKERFVEIEVEKVGRRMMDVQIVPTGVPPAGLLYNGSVTTPQTVEVFGPESDLKQVDHVQVTFRLESLVSGSTIELPVEVIDKEGKAVQRMRTDPGEVVIAPKSQAAPVTKNVPVNLGYEGTLPRGYRVVSIETDPPQVRVTGESASVSMLGGLDTSAINLDGRTEDFSQKVTLVIPDGIEPSVREVTVSVKIGRSGRG